MTKLQDRTTIRLRLWYFLPSDAVRRARYFLHTYQTFLSSLDYKSSFNYHQF